MMIESDNPKYVEVLRPNEGKILLKFESVHIVTIDQVIEYDQVAGLEILVETTTTFALMIVWVRRQTPLAIIFDTVRDHASG